MLGTANVAMARATESFAYFERHGMDCIPSRRSFQSARQLERDKLLGWLMAREHWAWAVMHRAMLADSGKVVRRGGENVTKKSKRSQLWRDWLNWSLLRLQSAGNTGPNERTAE